MDSSSHNLATSPPRTPRRATLTECCFPPQATSPKVSSAPYPPNCFAGDPYKDAGKLQMRAPKKEGHKEAGHDHAFKPAKTVKEPVKASYDHMTDYKEVKINRKTEDGVWTEPRNFLTNPPKPGQVGKQTSFGTVPYIEDDYNNKRKLEKKELEEHHKKMQEKPFSQRVKHKETFYSIREQLEENPPIPQRKPPAKREPLMTHDAPFKPSHPPKKGYNNTIDKFPEYKPDPMRVVQRQNKEEEKAKWKPPKTQKTDLAQTSVVTNYKNLKSEFPSVFRRM